MTLEEIKALLAAADGLEWAPDSELMDKAPEMVRYLLATLEETEHLLTDHGPNGRNYTNEQYITIQQELAEAHQTIARQQEAIDRASDMMNHKHPSYRILQDALLPSGEDRP